MERLTLDMEGARHGELAQASLQLGNDTIAVQRIATMSVEAHEFAPFDTPRNQRAKAIFSTFFVTLLFFAVLALSYWGLMGRGAAGAMPALGAGAIMMMGALWCLFSMARYAMKMRRREPYYRLLIGTSDGRQIPLVDDNRRVLETIRDAVRLKMDTGDEGITGHFDLNLDDVNIKGPDEHFRLKAAGSG